MPVVLPALLHPADKARAAQVSWARSGACHSHSRTPLHGHVQPQGGCPPVQLTGEEKESGWAVPQPLMSSTTMPIAASSWLLSFVLCTTAIHVFLKLSFLHATHLYELARQQGDGSACVPTPTWALVSLQATQAFGQPACRHCSSPLHRAPP